MVRTFVKKTVCVGGSVGVVIPSKVLYAEGIQRGMDVIITIAPADVPRKAPSGAGDGLAGIRACLEAS